MKKTVFLITSIITLCLYLQSCYEDLGNYEYKDDLIKEVSLRSDSKSSVLLGDTIKMFPRFEWTNPENDTTLLEFRWEINDSVVSNERNLEYIPDRILFQAPCVLYVTEKKTGLIRTKRSSITVISTMKAGWLLLAEKGQKSVLSYIRRDKKTNDEGHILHTYKDFKDIYDIFFTGESLGQNPKRLFNVFINKDEEEILVLQKPDLCVFLSGDDLSKYIYLKDEFIDKRYPDGFVPVDYIDAAQTTYLLDEDGNVYWKISPQYYGKQHLTRFIPIPLSRPGGMNIGFFPDVRVHGANMAHMYDVLNNRIIAWYSSFSMGSSVGVDMGVMVEFINNDVPADVADINNLEGYKLIFMGSNHPSYMLVLKHEDSGNYIYHTYSIQGYASFRVVKIVNHKESILGASSFFSDDSKFLLLRKTNYLFFSTGSKLYFYDPPTQRIKLYHDFGSGNIIKIAVDAPETEIGIALENGNFYICSTNIKFLAADNPGLDGGILHHVNDLGNVKDLIWKYGGYYNYVYGYDY